MPKQENQPTVVQTQEQYRYTIAYGSHKTSRRMHFSKTEIQHLAGAALLVVGVGLSFVGISRLFSSSTIVSAFTAIFTLSFFIHEIAHKAAAQRNGLWAEFRLIPLGALLTLLSAILPIKFISPGAVMVAGYADKGRIGRISIAGPITNMSLSTMFYAASFLPVGYAELFKLGAAFNAWIALFNLIPFGVFDGFKVFQWNKIVWAAAFTASLGLTVLHYQLFSF